MSDYSDIIHCRRPVSHHTRMSVAHRAKQFAPFAALKGYEESVRKKEIIYEPFMELSDEKKEDLDRRLRLLQYQDRITATFFVPGDLSLPVMAGHYCTVTGAVEFIDPQERRMRVRDTEIDFRWITELEGKTFDVLEGN